MSLRKIISLTALLSFVALTFSSVLAFVAPRGPGSGKWEALGLGKHEWFSLHTNLGVLFLIACIIHLILNIKPIIAYLKTKKEKKFRVFTLNFNIALLLTLWIILSSIYQWPPVSGIQSLKPNRSNHGKQQTEAPATQKVLPEEPPFLYSYRSITRLCNTYAGLDAGRMVDGLVDLGIDAEADWSFREIAKANDMDVEAVYDAFYRVQ